MSDVNGRKKIQKPRLMMMCHKIPRGDHGQTAKRYHDHDDVEQDFAPRYLALLVVTAGPFPPFSIRPTVSTASSVSIIHNSKNPSVFNQP